MIIVAGSGIAGMCAAIEAARAGSRVILLEKDRVIGGNSRWAGGFDIESPTFEEMREHDPDGDPVLQRVLVDHFQTDIAWLQSLGIELNETRPGRFDYAPHIGEGGIRAFRVLQSVFEKAGGQILTETALTRLLTNDAGEVVGVAAKGPQGVIKLRSNAVVLATGSFAQSNDFKTRYLGPYGDRTSSYGTDQHHGDGLRVALEVGAALSSGMSISDGGCVFPPPFQPPAGLQRLEALDLETSEPVPPGVQNYAVARPTWRDDPVVLVNLDGERYVDESARYTVVGWKTSCQPEGIGFSVFDRLGYERKARAVETAVAYGAALYQADTLEVLAAQLRDWKTTQSYRVGVRTRAFLRTMREFNQAVERGITPELDPPRRENIQEIAVPPFYAMPVVQGVVDVIGGIKINAKSQALDTAGRPILGLYVAGEDAGRPYTVEHGGLSFGLIFGRIAGKNAAMESPRTLNSRRSSRRGETI